MKKSWALGLVAAVGMLFVIQPLTVLAEKPFPGKLLSYLPILHKDNQDTCKICHTQTMDPGTRKKDPKWNVFGEAMKKAHDDLKTKLGHGPSFDEMFDAVKDLDSDGDGVSNIIELVAGTKPGDKESKPTEEQITAAKKQVDEWVAKNAGAQPKPEPAPEPAPAPAPTPAPAPAPAP